MRIRIDNYLGSLPHLESDAVLLRHDDDQLLRSNRSAPVL
jgi:hypothetical protein